MRKFYDDFIQQKPKEMSKTLEDIAFKYINPTTQQPTKVPASHFEKELGQEIERTISQTVSRQFLTIMYNQLSSLMKEDKELFYKALICIDNNLNPKDLRISEQIALNHTCDYIAKKAITEKKEFRFFNQDISNEYRRAISDPDIQAEAMEISNFLENQETRDLNSIKQQDEMMKNSSNYNQEIEEDEDLDMDYDSY